MRIAKLIQIFGMLAATATLCGAEAAIAQQAAAPSSMKTIGAPSASAAERNLDLKQAS
ncbi:hypothetical protein IVB22_26300 [Bradyrhizobium sp. 190]|uniref:hypothetical protein n=1 Tax=Bradyrhizobium sp. 190 TaxID=2782658 RepID=UPI001FFC1972|nr:hypothetical protein [Bradyrhizobium sp. 190]MCK1516005.1 hypothetical protein [Bradyrhizobium sp. 190]